MTQLVAVAGFGANGVRRSREALLRKALFASTALVGVALATPAAAQVSVTPTGGGTVVSDSGTPDDQTASGGGVRIYDISDGSGVTVSGVTINQTVTGPTANALSVEVPSGPGGLGVTFNGASSISTTVNGGAAVAISNTGNLGVAFNAGSTFTGSYGFNISNPNGFVAFNSRTTDAQGNTIQSFTQNIVASGTAVTGINLAALLNAEVYLGTSTISGFATGVNVTTTDTRELYALVNSTGGSISASQIGIRIAPGPASTGIVQSQSAITAPTGIQVTGGGGAVITTSGGGTINSNSSGTGTGIIASSSAGADPVSVTVGAAIGGTTAFATGVNATNGGTGTVSVTTTAPITATTGISVSSGAATGNTVNVGGNINAYPAGGVGVNVQSSGFSVILGSGASISAPTGVSFQNGGNITVSGPSNYATINASGAAINMLGGAAGTTNTITNNGLIIGLVNVNSAANTTINLANSLFGNVAVDGTGTRTSTISSSMIGNYTATNASGVGTDNLTIGGSATFRGNVTLGDGNDTVIYSSRSLISAANVSTANTNAGIYNNLFDGGGGTDSFTVTMPSAANAVSIELGNLTNFESYALTRGILTLTGSRNGGAGWSLQGGTLNIGTDATTTGTLITPGVAVTPTAGTALNVRTGSLLRSTGDVTVGNVAGAFTINNAGTIDGTSGNTIQTPSAALTLTNSGTISTSNYVAVLAGTGSTITSTGTITGGTDTGGYGTGVELGGTGTVNNNNGGTITSAGNYGVLFDTASTLNNAAGATVSYTGSQNTNGAAVWLAAGGTINNLGLIAMTGSSGQAITLANGGTITNGAANNTTARVTTTTGTNSFGSIALFEGSAATTVNNYGKMDGSAGGLIQYSGTGALTVNNLGTAASIYGGYDAVSAGSGGLTLTNAGKIVGGTSGIVSSGTASITNTGTIGGGTLDGSNNFAAGGGGFAVEIAGGTVNNLGGTLQSGGAGVYQTNAAATLKLVNTGTIGGLTTAAAPYGQNPDDTVVATGAATVFNSGTIATPLFYAVSLAKGGSVTNAAGGLISAGTQDSNRYGVHITGASGSVNNYGTIKSTSTDLNRGIQTDDNAATINLYAGSTTGSIVTGAGSDTLTLYNGTGTAFTGTTYDSATNAVTAGITTGATKYTVQAAGTNAAAAFATGATVNLGGGTNTLTLRGTGDGTTANGAAGSLDVSTITNATHLVKSDAGTWTLTGNPGTNDFQDTGSGVGFVPAVSVSAGRLITANPVGQLNGRTVDISSGATLELDVDSLVYEGGATFTGAGVLQKTNSGNFASRSLVALAAGGLIDVQAGGFTASSDVQGRFTGNLGSLNVATGANFYTSEAAVVVDKLTGTGTVNTDIGGSFTVGINNGSATFDGVIVDQNGTPGGTLTKTGTGAQTLTGVNTYTGATTISGGTLALAGSGTIASSSGLADGGSFDISGLTNGGTTINTLTGSGLVKLGGNTLTLATPGTIAVSMSDGGLVANTGGKVTLNGGGTYIFTGANTYTGATTINGGATLQGTTATLSNFSAITDNGTLAFVQGGTGGTFAPGISGSGAVTVSGTGANALTFAGALTQTGGLTVSGTSNVTLTGSYGNGANNAPISSGTGTFTNLGAVRVTGTVGQTNGIFLLPGGTLNNGDGTHNQASLIATDSALIVNAGAGAGVVTVSNAGLLEGLNYEGVTVRSGSLALTNAGTGVIYARGTQETGTAWAAGTDTANVSTSVTNQAGGQIVGRAYGVRGTTASDIVTNSGTIASGTWTAPTAGAVYSTGTIAVGGTAGVYLTAGGTVNNGTSGGTAAANAASVIEGGVGVQSNAALALTNYGIVTGSNAGSAGVNASGTGSILTNYGTVQGGKQAIVLNNGGTVYNYGSGSVLQATNTASLTDASGVYSNGALTLTNQGTISTASTGTSYGVEVIGVGTITNSGSITAASRTALSTTGVNSSVTNQAGGTIVGATGGIRATNTVSINNTGLIGAGTLSGGTTGTFTANGNTAIATAGGTVENTSDATIGGALTSSAALTLNNAGSLNAVTVTGTGNSTISLRSGSTAGVVTLGSGNDGVTLFTGTGSSFAGIANPLGGTALVSAGVHNAATVTGLALGTGTNTVTLSGTGTEVAAGSTVTGQRGSLALNTVSGLSTLTKTGTGTWVLSGAADTSTTGGIAATSAATINAGNGTPSGLLVFNGTTGLTGAINVNGATIQALSAGAFGTGTITATDPTIQYSATGTYANPIVLASTNTASDPTNLQADNGVNATLSGVISEATAGQPLVINVAGSTGTITLTGNNTYTGVTTVAGGTLAVNGTNVSGATVASGATLTGTGSVGATTIADGGILVGTQGSTLTMASLGLTSGTGSTPGSIINATFGAPNGATPGAAALFAVTGNLTLDGTVNVADTGAFGFGVYRLISYGGTLTDNGLAVGTVPMDAQRVTVQTAVAGQVNIVSSSSTLQFWDGDNAALYNNGMIDGGSGTWTAASPTFTDANGLFNGAMNPQPGMAVFEAAPGVVTVDNSAGAIAVTGMQFASSGYVVTGGDIGLAASTTAIRVGDGTNAGAGYTATIASALTGANSLDKTDLGTLILSGANSYTGMTTISGGVLQGTTTSIVGSNIVDNATLAYNQAASGTAAQNISGNGVVTVTGLGAGNALTFAGTDAQTGGFVVTDASNTVFAGTATGAATEVALQGSGATLTNNGGSTIVGGTYGINATGPSTVNNSGTIASGTYNGGAIAVGGTDGVYLANGGAVTNAAGGLIEGTTGVVSGGALTLTNAANATISGVNAGVTAAAGSTINNAGTIAATAASNFSTNAAVILAASPTSIINNTGSITGANDGVVVNGGGRINNAGTITGGGTGNGVIALASANALVIANSGSITGPATAGTGYWGVAFENASGTLVNTGLVQGDEGLEVTTGSASVVNGATGTIAGTTYGVQTAGSSALALNSYGTITGNSSILGTGANALSLQAGSSAGAITTGSGADTLSLYTGSVTTAAVVDAVTGLTVQSAGTHGAATFGAINLGTGANVLALRGAGDGTAANGTGGSLALNTVTNVPTITKQDTGTWTLTGAATASVAAAAINAGVGGTPASGGLLVFSGTGLTGPITVNGATIRATTGTAFGTGTINEVSAITQLAATATYANNVVLQSATVPTLFQTVGTGITATLSGAITQGAGAAAQPLVFGSIDVNGNPTTGTFVLTNAGNAWSGVTTINAGTTLRGTTATLSGGSFTDNGVLNVNQGAAGTSARAIAGSGTVLIDGGGPVTLTGAITASGGVQIGANTTATLSNVSGTGNTVVTLSGANAVLNVAAGGTIAATNGGAVFGTAQNGTVNNAGTIGSTGNFNAVYFNPNLGTATVANTGTVSAANGSAVYAGAGTTLTVTNTGALTSVNRPAILAAGAATVTNGAAGTINGFFGVYANGALTLNNAGQITAAGAGGNAVTAGGGGTIVNTGTLTATTTGGWGVQMSGAGSVDNQGTINADSGLVATTGTGVSLTNEGNITATSNGVWGYGTAVALTNTGTITGGGATGTAGVRAEAAGSSIANAGTIQASSTAGVGVYMTGGTLTNQSGGTISGGMVAGGGYGTAIQLAGTGNVLNLLAGSTVNGRIDASGTTDGSNSYTFSGTLNGGFTGGSGNDMVTLVTPVTVSGTLDGGAGTDTLVLDGTGTGTLGSAQVVNFENGVKQGTGTWTLTGTTAASPTAFAINAGTLAVTGGNALADNGAVTIASGATLQLNASETIGSLAGAGNVTLGANTLTTGGLNASSTFAGVASGTGGLTKVGTGTLTLSGANTYTGATTVSAGTLALGASNVIADASAVGVATGATLNLGANSDTVASLTLAGTLAGTGTLTASTYTLTGATVAANLGAGTLNQAGGTSVLNGTAAANRVNVNAGTLALGASNRLADTATVMIASGAILDLGANSDTVGLVGIAGTLAGTGTLSAAEYDLSGANVNANLGTGNLFQLAGTSTLNGTAGAANVAVNAGTLVLGASNRLADNAAVGVATGATLNMGANSDTVGTAALAGTLAGTGTLTAASYTLNAATVNANLGTGTLVQAGGTSVLSGPAATGTVAVMAGTLRLGASDRIADAAMLGVASGATFDLAGYNETVGTLAGTGTLALGAGTLTAGGTNADYAFGGNVTGTGDLTKVGTGTFSLIGNEGVTGRLNVNAGTLMLAGTTAGSVRVQGGTLTGASTIAGNLLLSSGTLSPGIATQPVAMIQAGSLTVTGGTSVFDFGGTASGFTADLLKITGAATLSGGTVTTRGLDASANYKMAQTYTVLTSGGLTGAYANGTTFTQVSNNADLYYRLRYDLVANGVVLEVRKPVDFTTTLGAGATGNQLAIARALNGAILTASDSFAGTLNAISLLTPDQRRATLDSIGGESIADISTGVSRIADRFTDLLRQRLAVGGGASGDASLVAGIVGGKRGLDQVRASGQVGAEGSSFADGSADNHAGAWVQTFGGAGRLDGSNGTASIRDQSYGVAAGIDAKVAGLTVGGAFAATALDTRIEGRASTNRGTLYQGGGYVAYDNGQAYASAVGSYFSGDVDSSRQVYVGAAFQGNATGTARVTGYTAGGAAGYRIALGGGTRFTPQVSAQATHVDRDAFTETGAGGLSLATGKDVRNLYTATLEGRLSHVSAAPGGIIEPYAGAGVAFNFGDLDTLAANRFTGAPTGTGAFSIAGARLAPTTALINGGIEAHPTDRVTLGMGVETRLSNRERDGRLELHVRLGF